GRSLGAFIPYHASEDPSVLLASDALYLLRWKSEIREQRVHGLEITAMDGNRYQVSSAEAAGCEIVSWIDHRASKTLQREIQAFLGRQPGWESNDVWVGSIEQGILGTTVSRPVKLSRDGGNASCVVVAANPRDTVVLWVGFDSVGFDPRDTNQ